MVECELEVILRVENAQRVVVEWPCRIPAALHQQAHRVIQQVPGVDGVAATVYREIVQVAPHVSLAEVVAQDIANALLDDSGAFYRTWRELGYSEIVVSVRRW